MTKKPNERNDSSVLDIDLSDDLTPPDLDTIGDGPSASDIGQAMEAHLERSPTAQRVDERRAADVTTDLDEWREHKATMDYPGVDTPASRDLDLTLPWED